MAYILIFQMQLMKNLIYDPKQQMKGAIRSVIGETGVNVLRKIVKK